MFNFPEQHIAIYKANRRGQGAAAQFKISKQKRCMFLEMAKQNGEKSFDWEGSKIVVKLGPTDITKMLAVLNHNWPLSDNFPREPDLKLYHENPKGNKAIHLSKQRNENYPGFFMQVSISEGDRRDRINLPISLDEAEYLKIGFSKAVEIILGW